MNLFFDRNISDNAALYLINKSPTHSIPRNRLWLMLYFADREFLIRHQLPLTTDGYSKQPEGYVPVNLSNSLFLKLIVSGIGNDAAYSVLDGKLANLDFLSNAKTDCLDEIYSLLEYVPSLVINDLSHGSAWVYAKMNEYINVFDIINEYGLTHELPMSANEIFYLYNFGYAIK